MCDYNFQIRILVEDLLDAAIVASLLPRSVLLRLLILFIVAQPPRNKLWGVIDG